MPAHPLRLALFPARVLTPSCARTPLARPVLSSTPSNGAPAHYVSGEQESTKEVQILRLQTGNHTWGCFKPVRVRAVIFEQFEVKYMPQTTF